MNKISCDMCMDLMPLVQDGVASADSIAAVEQHIENCPACKALFEGQIPIPSDSHRLIKKIQKQLHIFVKNDRIGIRSRSIFDYYMQKEVSL